MFWIAFSLWKHRKFNIFPNMCLHSYKTMSNGRHKKCIFFLFILLKNFLLFKYTTICVACTFISIDQQYLYFTVPSRSFFDSFLKRLVLLLFVVCVCVCMYLLFLICFWCDILQENRGLLDCLCVAWAHFF